MLLFYRRTCFVQIFWLCLILRHFKIEGHFLAYFRRKTIQNLQVWFWLSCLKVFLLTPLDPFLYSTIPINFLEENCSFYCLSRLLKLFNVGLNIYSQFFKDSGVEEFWSNARAAGLFNYIPFIRFRYLHVNVLVINHSIFWHFWQWKSVKYRSSSVMLFKSPEWQCFFTPVLVHLLARRMLEYMFHIWFHYNFV